MERLTETIGSKGYCNGKSACEDDCTECNHFETMVDRLAYYEDLEEECHKTNHFSLKHLMHKWEVFLEDVHELLKYRELEEQGLLLRLPCKIGDEMWAIRHYRGALWVQKGFVSEMFFNADMKLIIVVKHIARGQFGKTVFATQEEAEKQLETLKRLTCIKEEEKE